MVFTGRLGVYATEIELPVYDCTRVPDVNVTVAVACVIVYIRVPNAINTESGVALTTVIRYVPLLVGGFVLYGYRTEMPV